MRNLLAKELKIRFIETLNGVDNFSYEEGNPFLIKIDEQQFFVFLKNLSPAYFKNSPDITRVQLPFSDHFDKIFKTNIPFVILGYDVDNDVIVSWNPSRVKDRLNAKSNVSLYSRNSLQSEIEKDEFKIAFLSNGEKIILFKRESLQVFFKKTLILFNDDHFFVDQEDTLNEPKELYLPERLHEITDEQLLNLITPLLKKNKVLEAVEVSTKYYSDKYPAMSFKEWYKLINDLYNSIK